MDNNNEQPTIVSSNDVNNDKFVIKNDITTTIDTTPLVDNTVPPVANTQSIPVVQNTTQVPVQPQTTPNVNGTDPNAMVNENLKKVEINYTPPSKAKVVLLVLFFIVLLGFIIFLPDINTLVSKFTGGNEEPSVEKITTGRLKCSISTNTTNLDIDHDYTFRFTDNKLEKVELITTTKGDVTLDEETLNKLSNTCKQLKENVKGLKGVSIQCNYSDGKLEEIQSFELKDLDTSKLNSAFSEAGGTLPTYQYEQDIDKIEGSMNASKYECVRER